ncbi:N5-glutamine S-adenosyl-L-methionine-dependent methyltransferase [Caulifigura coniformis]|uniref:N5-glutamine S-adenosyl-L-methionine-dependent methyltransferase n=1 Tax=Caulifigura coniformis TaxID=2527983 RepID=A0A517SH73_9PLAN|nr:methyltransferase domain-containing protein [Caulifigura coniformis]QDT55479.1 N5-glutamine S-adenosyl-L-methionine-dependent methyltransferase [Caulifigura coniformis]
MSGASSRDPGPFDDVSLLERLRNAPDLFERLKQSNGTELALQKQLRAEYPEDLVRAALLLHDLRKRGVSKFLRADQMWFDRTGLEQSTSETVAKHKAGRLGRAAEVVDLCCGIGADALAIAALAKVQAVDLRPAACLMAKWNAEAYGLDDRIEFQVGLAENADLRNRPFHIDPDRRPGGQRSLRIEDHRPGLEFLQQLALHPAGGVIKLSPASNFGGKFPGCEIELVSLNGECKEALVWCGPLRTETDWRATVLPTGDTLTGDPWSAVSEQSPLRTYLFDPDPAVVRAGLVDVLCESTGLARLDREEEYLTGDTAVPSPFVQTFEVIAQLSNNEREIRNWFRRSDCGQVEIKCRRIPVVPEKVRKHLSLEGKAALVLVYARIAGKAHAVVCRRCTA